MVVVHLRLAIIWLVGFMKRRGLTFPSWIARIGHLRPIANRAHRAPPFLLFLRDHLWRAALRCQCHLVYLCRYNDHKCLKSQ